LPLLDSLGAGSSPAISEVTDSDRWYLALRRDGWKLIANLQADTLDVVEVELYDLQADPNECNDMVAHEQQRASFMQRELLEAADSIRDQSQGETILQAEMDEEVRERLRALGYVD
jgi:arylsulfatase A-like enzyme